MNRATTRSVPSNTSASSPVTSRLSSETLSTPAGSLRTTSSTWSSWYQRSTRGSRAAYSARSGSSAVAVFAGDGGGVLGVGGPVQVAERAGGPAAGLGDEGDVACLRQAGWLALAGPDRVDLVEGDQQVGAAQVGAAQVVAFVGGQLPAAWQPALERGGVGVEGERGPSGGDPVGVVQVHRGLLWLGCRAGAGRVPPRPSGCRYNETRKKIRPSQCLQTGLEVRQCPG